MRQFMELIDLGQKARELSGRYENVVISRNNDHEVRISRMTSPTSGTSIPIQMRRFLESKGC
jgi:hypothetical protein